jgi:hypothetical protein
MGGGKPMSERADLDERVAAKWHARECGCADPECDVLAAKRDRARQTGDIIGRALTKRFGKVDER